MSIWAMPESQKLEAQTLDKLALAPWNLPRDGTNTAAIVATNSNSLLLRPLLEDLVQEECYLEIRSSPAGAGSTAPGSQQSGTLPRAGSTTEIALAIRIDDTRSRLWKTNLTALLDSLTSHAGLSNFRPTFLRTANWTVVAILPLPKGATPPQGVAFGQDDWIAQLTSGLGQNNNLFTAEETNSLLETELDLNGVSSALGLGWKLPTEVPKISLSLGAEGELVRTTGRLNFKTPLPLNLDEWQIPTNLVHDPLTSFTAIRGIKSLLASSRAWNSLQLGPPPNQLYLWAQGSLPITIFWAAPLLDASNHIYQFTEHLVNDANPWVTTNTIGRFARTTNANAAVWGDLPFMEPYMRSITLPEGDFIMGGLGTSPSTNRPAPQTLFDQFLPRTNLVCYDWELTGDRIEPSIYNIQLLRFLFQKAQIPPESTSFAWLKALETKLGNSATLIALTRPDTLTVVRKSSLGFTGIELQILADWLESPGFPNSLTTFAGTPSPLPTHLHRTNSVAPHSPKQ
jgi:hypothetical protein